MKRRITNEDLIKESRSLRKSSKNQVPLWNCIADKLEKAKHGRIITNLGKINRYTKDGDTVLVPGKVLGAGILDHKVHVAAFSLSKNAKQKIEEAGGEFSKIGTLVKNNPEGRNVKIIC